MVVDFNRKIDAMYLNLNTKFKDLNTHVKKMENQVIQTREALERHEAMVRVKEEARQKHHVNVVIDDDFWVEVKRGKLEEENFRVEIRHLKRALINTI